MWSESGPRLAAMPWTARGLLVLIIAGSAAMWQSGTAVWTFALVGVVLLWAAWMLAGMLHGQGRAPIHPVQLAAALPAAVLTGHFLVKRLTPIDSPRAIDGTLDASMVIHLWLFSLMLMLAQDLFARRTRGVGLLLGGAGCAVSLLALAGAAIGWGQGASHSFILLGLSGAALGAGWLIDARRDAASPVGDGDAQRRGGIRSRPLLAVGASILAALMVAWYGWVMHASADGVGVALLGAGEDAFRQLSGRDAGAAVWLRAAGLPAISLSAAMIVGWLVWAVGQSRCGWRGRALHAVAALLVLAAWMAPGGSALPGPTLFSALVLGTLASNDAKPARQWHGVWVLAPFLVVAMMLAIGRTGTMVEIAAFSHGLGDKWEHAIVGFLVTLALGWLFGARWWWLGLIACALGAGSGYAAEWAQLWFSSRKFEGADWQAHLLGGMAATALCCFAWLVRSMARRAHRRYEDDDIARAWGVGLAIIAATAFFTIQAGVLLRPGGLAPPRVDFYDNVAVKGRWIAAYGCVEGECHEHVFFFTWRDEPIERAVKYHGRYLPIPDRDLLPIGATPLRVVGHPYGPYSRQVSRPVMQVIEKQAQVVFVDARVLETSSAPASSWARLSSGGVAAVLCVDIAKPLEARRAALAARLGGEPLMVTLPSYRETRVEQLQRAANMVSAGHRAAAVLITRDPLLARDAVSGTFSNGRPSRRFRVLLIGGSESAQAARDVFVVDSLAEAAAWVADLEGARPGP